MIRFLYMRRLLCTLRILIALYAFSPLSAQPAPDSLRVKIAPFPSIQVRTPDSKAIKAWQKESEFQYQRPKPPEKSWLNTLWEMLKEWFERILGKEASNWVYQNWAYFAFVLITVFVVWRIMVADRFGLFARSQTESGVGVRKVGDIHGVDFEQEIRIAVSNHDYREAVRLHYLQLLKQLQERNLIRWKRDKTNHDYLRELQNTPFSESFRTLTQHFEYIFYGEMAISESEFGEIQRHFGAILNDIRGGAKT